jgi:phage-related protein
LSREDRRKIGNDLRTVQIGWPLGMPLVRSIGERLWEVRSRILNGIARIVFIFINGEIILLNGFVKKSQKMPLEELRLAKIRAKKYKQEEGK